MEKNCLWILKGRDEYTNEKIYCIERNKYRKFVNPKISYIFQKALVLSIICSKCGSNNQRILNIRRKN